MKDVLSALYREARFTPAAPYQRFAYFCAALLVVSGVVHGAVYLVDGGSWAGPLSWRKPIVFGLSFGITLATLAWFMSFLRPRKATGWGLMSVLAVASVGEVFLISMQTWRGVASHFNEATDFDGLVFSLMGMLVTLVALVTVIVAVMSLRRIDAPASLAWAIRAGLVLLLVGQAVGTHMIIEGGNSYGADGVMKVPHAFTLHAVQVLPLLALLLSLSDFPERRRINIVAVATTGYASLIASTMLQTYRGRGPLDLDLVSSALALAGLVLLAVCAVVALRGLASRRRPPPADRTVRPDRSHDRAS